LFTPLSLPNPSRSATPAPSTAIPTLMAPMSATSEASDGPAVIARTTVNSRKNGRTLNAQ
jgi:hypothetical protein